MKKSINHVHKFRKLKLGKQKTYEVFSCTLPNCTTYYERTLALGKQCVCWSCGDIFQLNSQHLKMAKPTCGCRSKSSAKAKLKDFDTGGVLDNILDSILKDESLKGEEDK